MPKASKCHNNIYTIKSFFKPDSDNFLNWTFYRIVFCWSLNARIIPELWFLFMWKPFNMTSLYHSFFNIYKLTHFKFKGKILTYSHRATTFLVVLSGSMFLSLWMKFYRSKTFLLNWRAELAFRNIFFYAEQGGAYFCVYGSSNLVLNCNHWI